MSGNVKGHLQGLSQHLPVLPRHASDSPLNPKPHRLVGLLAMQVGYCPTHEEFLLGRMRMARVNELTGRMGRT